MVEEEARASWPAFFAASTVLEVVDEDMVVVLGQEVSSRMRMWSQGEGGVSIRTKEVFVAEDCQS